MKQTISSLLLLLLLTAGCSMSSVRYAPPIDADAPTAVRVYLIRSSGTFFDRPDANTPWVVGIDDRDLCQLQPGEYTVMNTTEGDIHWVKAKRLAGWWHERQEPIIAEPDTDYYFLTGVRDNSMFLEKIDLNSAVAHMQASSLVCGQPRKARAAVMVPDPSPVMAPPPAEEPVAVAAPPKPKPAPQQTGPFLVMLREVYFDLDKADIKPEMRKDLDAMADYLALHPSLVVVLGGHACDLGTEEHNFALSKRRSMAVRDYLIKAGVKKSRIGQEAFGETKPKYDNTTKAGRKLNRRVEFKFLDGF